LQPNISTIAKLIGDPRRGQMLTALMAGKALTATELASEADITAQTASSHLNKLVDGGLLVMRKQGRHKYFQLHDNEVAQLLESLLNVSAKIGLTTIETGPKDPRLKVARICYDHLAGEISVALYDALVENGLLIDSASETYFTDKGRVFFEKLGVNFSEFEKRKRPLCKSCLDWSERRNHLAGSLGQWILTDLISKGWAQKDLDSRAIEFTDKGLKLLKKRYQFI